jgi:hypothetical protein
MMGWKTKLKTGDEWDVVTGWRKYLCWTKRPGACKKVKRRIRRRDRHNWRNKH